MKSRFFLLFVPVLLGFGECRDRPPDAWQPNILLVIADDLSFDHYGFAGHPLLETPAIDALAASSVRYPATYVPSVCRPSLATLLTGLPEHRHGVTYLSGPQLGAFVTLADRLKAAGYSTYQAGKFWEGSPLARGFTSHAPFDSYVGNLSIGRTSIQPLFDFIDSTADPWLVWFSPRMPHSPHEAPDEFRALYQGLGLNAATVEYYAMISWFDAVVGELLAGIDEDTVVVFLADNGFVQSEIPIVPEPRSKGSSYEHGVRTQLLIRHPQRLPGVRWELADGVDVVATILALAGAEHSDLPGRDLLEPHLPRWSAFGSRSSLGLTDEPGVLQERWVRLGNWKLVDSVSGMDRLYDLGADPDEVENLIGSHELRFLDLGLRLALERWWSR